ncbi:MAG: hypothetical protein M3P39_08230 [Actinomycetota bacterium]|nr:hypothetical protein [Actinomycetota bacterium]
MSTTRPQPHGAGGDAPGSSGSGGNLLDRLREVIDRQSPILGERVNLRAQRARTRAAELRAQGKVRPAKLTEQAADRAQQAGDWLREVDADRLTQSANRVVENLKARRQSQRRQG